MNYLITDFQDSLRKSFISSETEAKDIFLPEILTNDSSKGIKVLNSIIEKLTHCDEFCFSSAFITTSGVATLFNTLEALKFKGISGKILTSKYLEFTDPKALERIIENFPNIDLRILESGNLHAKGYVFTRGEMYDIIIGSSNLTSSALSLNKEWNLKVSTHKNGLLTSKVMAEFQDDFESATSVTKSWLIEYQKEYQESKNNNTFWEKNRRDDKIIVPNNMQKAALNNLQKLRKIGVQKALLISATGTGKTYLSAFDVASIMPKNCLFVVHRRNIAEAAMNTFKKVIGNSRKMGIYSGEKKEIDSEFLFTTIQTLSRDKHLHKFSSTHFDYIIIDESHRSGGQTYQKLLDYFQPEFLLGMTATPERTDGFDIFSLFDHNIAYEIRLHKALEENMLSEFHYYGVQDITVEGHVIDENSDFRFLEAKERIDHLIKISQKYGTDNGVIRGLVFCSRKEECKALSNAFNSRGYKTVALTGDDNEEKRIDAIQRLESDTENKLDYIFTVDIFNEGIDIPKVNQILMIRPTNSAIIFVQQLGRGLRKAAGKSYVTIIDFIGNYQNNYLVPIALYGDSSYNKDTLRKLISTGSKYIPGSSTINFDEITKDRIYKSIDTSNVQTKKDLLHDYNLLKFKIGRNPMMTDFLDHGSRNPFQYVQYSKHSFYEFASKTQEELKGLIQGQSLILLKYLSKEINNTIRVEESIILLELIQKGIANFANIESTIAHRFGYSPSQECILSAIHNLNLNFITENHNRKLVSVSQIYNLKVIELDGETIRVGKDLREALENNSFKEYLLDATNYSIRIYQDQFKPEDYNEGFIRFKKYSRKDCFRVLNWDQQPLAQNVGGYMFHPNNKNCPVFLNYHKEEHISETTKYEDGFQDQRTLVYMSKSKRTLSSPDVQKFRDAEITKTRLPLFVKKENAEGDDFYYMGDLTPDSEKFVETTMGSETKVSVVQMTFYLDKSIESSMYKYITE